MNSITAKITGKIKSALAFPRQRRLYLKHTVKKAELKIDGRYAIINMDRQFREDDYSRYLYLLCMFMERAGFKPVVRMEWWDMKGIDGHGFRKILWKENYLFVRHCPTPINTIVLKQPGAIDHTIQIAYGYNIPDSAEIDCIAPYPMAPPQYVNYSQIADELQTSRRTFKVFFSGKTRKRLYGRQRLQTFFNFISRPEVIEFILNRFSDRTRSLKTQSDTEVLGQLLHSNEYLNGIIISEVKTDPGDWLKILSKADFFLCPPGARMPWSHNAIEAMSVGTIPIIEYGDFFHPTLEHMKTCIRYSSYEELEHAINQALNMPSSQIETMRKNVTDYYKKYLSAESIIENINTFCNSPKEKLRVAVPFIPTKKEAKAIPSSKTIKVT
jgi:hypothetical protein